MFNLCKTSRGRLAPLLLLLMVLLLPGCSSSQPEQADGGPQPSAGTQAAQTPRPGDEAAPQPGAAEGTAIPSATAEGIAAPASPGAAATQPPAGASEPAAHAPASPGAAATQPPAGTGKPAARASASPGAAATQPPAGTGKPAAHAPASPGTAATQPPAGTGKPAAQSPAATAKPPAAKPHPAATPKPDNVVTLSITGDEEHGVILAAAPYEFVKGESVLELLKRITRGQKIQMEYQGSKTFAYVEGIDNLYENDHGSESGWMYKVNGEFPSKAAGSWIVEPGDTIEWLYTLDLGKDLGAKAP
ncbi:DUF4430 domain-containing protein [Paenibacillus sp. FSL K6-1217]|uniref:DUF4430 domain-containing protein n=1 Tax=Paenibacillus sp. FSL K6-1217 TaxID=2921466 RepID=UPI00324BFAB0